MRAGANVTCTIDNVSAREIPGSHASQTTTASCPLASSRINKCANFNASPVDLTGITSTGDAAAVVSIVDDAAALAAAGISSSAPGGKVIRLDNTAGTAAAIVTIAGVTGNVNSHVSSAYLRMVSGAGMPADGDDELHAMAKRIGVARKWWQSPARISGSHYDIALTKRAASVKAGAVEITYRQAGAMSTQSRATGELGAPADAWQWLKAHMETRRTAASPEAAQ